MTADPAASPDPTTAAEPAEPRPVGSLARWLDPRSFRTLFALFFAMLVAWGIGTPLQQSPDEWSHLYRAAGIFHGQILSSEHGPMNLTLGDPIRVPGPLVADRIAAKCFMHHNRVPVSCSHPKPATAALVLTSTPAARYPPFYYAAVGWPLLFGQGSLTLYGMRVIAAAISAAFLAWGMRSALRLGAGLAATGVVLAVTPMVAWLTTMINPNGLEIAAAVSLWPQLLLWFTGVDPRLRRLGAIGAGCAAAAMVLCRSVAVIWVCAALVSMLPLIRRGWFREQVRTRSTYLAAAGVIAAGLLTLLWSVVSRQTQLAPLRSRTFSPRHDSLMHNLGLAYHLLPLWWHEAIGDFGWLDTPISFGLLHLYDLGLVLLAVLAIVVGTATGRFRVVCGAAIAAALTIAVTVYLAGSEVNKLSIGFWQGRYSIPMGVGVPVLLGYAVRTRGRWSRWLLAGAALAVGAVVSVVTIKSFLLFFRRNSVGLGHPLSLHGGWQPPGGIELWLMVLALSLAGLVLASVVATHPIPRIGAARAATPPRPPVTREPLRDGVGHIGAGDIRAEDLGDGRIVRERDDRQSGASAW